MGILSGQHLTVQWEIALDDMSLVCLWYLLSGTFDSMQIEFLFNDNIPSQQGVLNHTDRAGSLGWLKEMLYEG